jgi:hypothetical protein
VTSHTLSRSPTSAARISFALRPYVNRLPIGAALVGAPEDLPRQGPTGRLRTLVVGP